MVTFGKPAWELPPEDYSAYADSIGKTIVTLTTMDGKRVTRMFPGGEEPNPADVYFEDMSAWDGV